MDNNIAFESIIKFLAMPARDQIKWLVNLPNDLGKLNSEITPKTNEMFALVYGSRLLFASYSTWGNLSDNEQELADELNWLLITICDQPDENLWTAHGLKKSISWSLVRRLSSELCRTQNWGLKEPNIHIKELLQCCDIEDVYG